MNNLNQTFRYYLFSFLSFILNFFGTVGMRFISVLIGVTLALKLESDLGEFAFTLGWIFSLIIFAFAFGGLEIIYPHLEKLDDYAKTYKRYPYSEKYGSNFPKPKPEDFGISHVEFEEYNNRFQFEFIKMFFTYGLLIAGCIYLIKFKLPTKHGIILIGAIAIAAILLNYLFKYWNNKISQKHIYYKKIKNYQEAVHIYYKILGENFGKNIHR
jgi:hypothetical protein